MDFKSILIDKHGYDTIFVVVDRLSKQAISALYFKIVIVEDIAKLFISYVYKYYEPP